ncbi:MAG: RDD family protein [Bacillota bacterium]
MTSQNESYAGFWIRAVALLIDFIIIKVCFALIDRFYYLLYVTVGLGAKMEFIFYYADYAMIAVSFIAYWLYFAKMESSTTQGTLGKMFFGIIVTDLNGQRISFKTASIRFFGKIISTVILLIGFFMAAFSPKKQALHDIIAGTYLVKRGKYTKVPV